MYHYEVAPNQIIRQEHGVFTYHSMSKLVVGQIVKIPIGSRLHIGVIMREVTTPPYKTKTIDSLLPLPPLPVSLVATARWMSEYYATHLAIVWQTLLPSGLTKKRREQKYAPHQPVRDRTHIVFTPDQKAAIATLMKSFGSTTLLQGVTGSGKTTVYIEVAKRVIERGKSVIMLVPEIALTSQLLDEFSLHFDTVILLHSKQTEAKRHQMWEQVLRSTKPVVVIGPRSALFSPVPDIGCIIIDEAHEPSFKQEKSPRYSALRVASVLGRETNSIVIFGSATPLVADRYIAEKNSRIVFLPTPAVSGAVKPVVQLVDMTKRTNFKSHTFFSTPLLKEITLTLDSGKQTLLFHNRRGSSSMTLCENCGWSAGCPHCFLPLTLHADQHILRCHVCGYKANVPTSCPQCQHVPIIHKGIGTKLIESELRKQFPKARIARFDADTEQSSSLQVVYKDLYDGSIDIAVGTQIIAKGLDLPHLRTVGVIQADAGLNLPDYIASERTFQLLTQVIGRVGRSHHATNVIVQSYQPTHPAVQAGLTQDYATFYGQTIAQRRHTHFPPFYYLLKLVCVYKSEKSAIHAASSLRDILAVHAESDIEILGPTPAFYERQNDTYRWQLLLKSSQRQKLIAVLQYVPKTHWQIELDPLSLLS